MTSSAFSSLTLAPLPPYHPQRSPTPPHQRMSVPPSPSPAARRRVSPSDPLKHSTEDDDAARPLPPPPTAVLRASDGLRARRPSSALSLPQSVKPTPPRAEENGHPNKKPVERDWKRASGGKGEEEGPVRSAGLESPRLDDDDGEGPAVVLENDRFGFGYVSLSLLSTLLVWQKSGLKSILLSQGGFLRESFALTRRSKALRPFAPSRPDPTPAVLSQLMGGGRPESPIGDLPSTPSSHAGLWTAEGEEREGEGEVGKEGIKGKRKRGGGGQGREGKKKREGMRTRARDLESEGQEEDKEEEEEVRPPGACVLRPPPLDLSL